jgi:hypothetical protein
MTALYTLYVLIDITESSDNTDFWIPSFETNETSQTIYFAVYCTNSKASLLTIEAQIPQSKSHRVVILLYLRLMAAENIISTFPFMALTVDPENSAREILLREWVY